MIQNLTRLLTLCLLLSIGTFACDRDHNKGQHSRKPAQITSQDVATLNQLYTNTYTSYVQENYDLARSAFEKYIQHPAYKFLKIEKRLNDFKSFIPLYLKSSEEQISQGRHLVFQTYLHEPDILDYLGREQTYKYWYLAGAGSSVRKDNKNTKQFFSYFIFNDDVGDYFDEKSVFEIAKITASLHDLPSEKSPESEKGFQLYQKILSLKHFQEELTTKPLPSLLIYQTTFLFSQLHADIQEQSRILRLYIFHPNMPEVFQEIGSTSTSIIFKALEVLWSSQCHADYAKAYSLYFPLLLKSGRYEPQSLFPLQVRAGTSLIHQGQFQNTLDVLVPLLENYQPNTRQKDITNYLQAKENVAIAYWFCGQRQQAITLFQEISAHPQLEEVTFNYQLLLINAMRYFEGNRDYDLITQSADRSFRNIPAFLKAHEDGSESRILCTAITAYGQMGEREKINHLVQKLQQTLQVKKPSSPKDQLTALLHPIALGHSFLGNSELCTQYLEESLESLNNPSDDLYFHKVKLLGKEYYNQRKYLKAAEWFDKINEKLPLLNKPLVVLSYIKAGHLKKARARALIIETLTKDEALLSSFNTQLYLSYAFSQSNAESDHKKSCSLLEALKDTAFLIISADENRLITDKEYGLGLSLLDISQGGENVFELLQQYQLELFQIDQFEETCESSIFTEGTGLSTNLKKDVLALHTEHKEKIKRKGIADPNKIESKTTERETAQTTENTSTPENNMPLLITSGAQNIIERFKSLDWKNINAVRWHDIQTFFSPQQNTQGIIFTEHGSGTDHVTYTIYKRGTDLSDSKKKYENKMITFVNQGSRTAPIKFYLKQQFREILIEMGYLTDDSEK
jgi:hypothetical protein